MIKIFKMHQKYQENNPRTVLKKEIPIQIV